jgi:hypothetical protein
LTTKPAKNIRAFTPVFAGYAVDALMLFAGLAKPSLIGSAFGTRARGG